MKKYLFIFTSFLIFLSACQASNINKDEISSKTTETTISSPSSIESSSPSSDKSFLSQSPVIKFQPENPNSFPGDKELIKRIIREQKEDNSQYQYSVDLSKVWNYSYSNTIPPVCFGFGNNGSASNSPIYITFNINDTQNLYHGRINFYYGVPNEDPPYHIDSFDYYIENTSTKEIRVFTVGDNTKTVKVNTVIHVDFGAEPNFQNQLSYGTDDLYLFYNNGGTISLITPNYAGNVPENLVGVYSEYKINYDEQPAL